MNRIIVFLPIVVALFGGLGFYLGTQQKEIKIIEGNSSFNQGDKVMKLNYIIDLIKEKYVDSVDVDDLTEDAIGQMLKKLDPHSAYVKPVENKVDQEKLQGHFGGVGIKFLFIDDTLTISNIIKNGPSEKAGLEAGDRVIEIENEDVIGIKSQDVLKKLKGEPKSLVKVTLFRKGEIIEKTIKRGVIQIQSVVASFMLDDETGYIKLIRFSSTSHDEVLLASQELLDKGMKKLILDLRNNGGGYLDVATQIADEFLENKKMIVYTKGRGTKGDEYYATKIGVLEDIELDILINSSSASASEIIAGAIQDNDRGTILGRRSFGKGLVQSPIQLKDGSLIRLTVSRYYTPVGRCIQKAYGSDIEYESEVYDRNMNGELFSIDSSVFVDSLKFTTQGGKDVYGGGGIMPDIFIPYDTSESSNLLSRLSYSGILNDFAFKYSENNREKILKLGPIKRYDRKFDVSKSIISDLIEFAESKSINFTYDEYKQVQNRFDNWVKAEIAGYVWDENERQYIYTQFDNDVKVSLENQNN